MVDFPRASSVARAITLPIASSGVSIALSMATSFGCESRGEPVACEAGIDCPVPRDGAAGVLDDATSPVFDAAPSDPGFDSGTSSGVPPGCRALFELCSASPDCCPPYACVSGTCR